MVFASCGTLANEHPFPTAVNSAQGPYRSLLIEETSTSQGKLLRPAIAQESGMIAEGVLYHSYAAALEERPERDASLRNWEIDWAQFESRKIHASSINERYGFTANPTPMFEAQLGWEGQEVYDPWVILRDGNYELYYAAEGGIGLARSASPMGPFQRVGDAPIVDNDGDNVYRRPSVVEFGGSLWMYLDDGAAIQAWQSNDEGNTWQQVGALELVHPNSEKAADEAELRFASAFVYTSPLGRQVLRLYFEARLTDDTKLVGLAASDDGSRFERYDGYVFERDASMPAVAEIFGGVISSELDASSLLKRAQGTMLVTSLATSLRGVSGRALFAAVAPGDTPLLPPAPEDEEDDTE